MNMLCQRLNVDVTKFLNSGEQKYTNVKQISKDEAGKFLATINEYQQNKQRIPEEIIGYNENWQEKMCN